ncbi:hypothetical protein AHF37_11608, partial [Paragonimus kellicotti]
ILDGAILVVIYAPFGLWLKLSNWLECSEQLFPSMNSKNQLIEHNLNSNQESDLKPSSAMDMVYVSSSSSSSCSSSVCTTRTSDEENKTPYSSRRNISFRRYVGLRLPQKSLFTKSDQFHKVDRYKPRGRRLIIVDCRYPYEFRGGHIQGAVNLAEWPKLCHFLFSSCCNARSTTTRTPNYDDAIQRKSQVAPDVPTNKPRASRTTFVLHCEFSSHRAPTLFTLLRNHDRLLHLTCYPALRYPNVYILRGGYAAFYRHHPELCVPSGYMKMHSRPDLLPIWKRYCHMVNRKQIESSALLAEVNFIQINPHWTSPIVYRREKIPHQISCSECNGSHTARKNIWRKIDFN